MILFLLLLLLAFPAEAATTLLPPGKMCLDDANGNPLVGGTVNFYVPSTTTPKTTWKDANQITANTNPVVLDSAGCAVIYGEGVYRQIVKDSLGNLVWDQLTADTGGGLGPGGVSAFLNPGGRLTLASGQPILTGLGQVAKSVIYYTPYNGNNIEVFNGSVLIPYTFAEISLTLDSNAGHVQYHQPNKNFDVYIIADTTVAPATLRVCTGPAWVADTQTGAVPDPRGPAAAISYTSYGYLANVNTITCRYGNGVNDLISIAPWRGTYVGTIRTIGVAAQVTMTMNPAPASGGAAPILFVFNEYNRVLIQANNQDNGAPYTYAVATPRIARADNDNQIQYVSGDISDAVLITYSQSMQTGPVLGTQGLFCIGVDLIGCTDNVHASINTVAAQTQLAVLQTTYLFASALGLHQIFAIEAVAAGTVTYDLDSDPGAGVAGIATLMTMLRM
jgi:hypothetical protein